jgi:hypothetical protein
MLLFPGGLAYFPHIADVISANFRAAVKPGYPQRCGGESGDARRSLQTASGSDSNALAHTRFYFLFDLSISSRRLFAAS